MKLGMTTRSAGTPSAELLSWDSEWWGVRIGKSATLMDEWAAENTVGCMWMLIPAADLGDIQRAQAGGAKIMDVRVSLEGVVVPPSAGWTQYSDDVEVFVPLARQAFRGLTRFYADPRLPDDRCDDLYENWLRTSHASGDVILTEMDKNRKPKGFVLVHVSGVTASIVLIAVEESERGKNIGSSLVAMAHQHAWLSGCQVLNTVTQGKNIAAQRTFQGMGLRTTDISVWLHKWADA